MNLTESSSRKREAPKRTCSLYHVVCAKRLLVSLFVQSMCLGSTVIVESMSDTAWHGCPGCHRFLVSRLGYSHWVLWFWRTCRNIASRLCSVLVGGHVQIPVWDWTKFPEKSPRFPCLWPLPKSSLPQSSQLMGSETCILDTLLWEAGSNLTAFREKHRMQLHVPITNFCYQGTKEHETS